MRCTPTANACNATGCDETGACEYPAGRACGNVGCTDALLTTGMCDGTGACNATAASCPGNLACDDGGLSCLTRCAAKSDCVAGHYCSAGIRQPKRATGDCLTSDACTSGICGTNGTGHCCQATCATSDANCGASDCNSAGACAYPALTRCGPAGICVGNTEVDPRACDGLGNCGPPRSKDCSPYVCGTSLCLTSCADNTECVVGYFCDIGNGACCNGLVASGILIADGAAGSDTTACCGIGGNGPCQTLSKAMALIDAAKANDVTLRATVNDGGGDWAPTGEVYPIILGWGVELSAPGVFFLDPNGVANDAILEVNRYSGNDTVGYASIVGTATDPIGVGMNASNGQQTADIAAIAVEKGNSLYLANASVNSSLLSPGSIAAILVGGGASLLLGQDRDGGVLGTVRVGNALGKPATDGWEGIVCLSDYDAGVGCTIRDARLTNESALVIQGQEVLDIDAEDFADISLSTNPVIGVAPVAAGFKQCANKNDATRAQGGLQAIWLNGSATFTFKNGTVQCIGSTAFQLQATTIGVPSLTIDNTVIQNTDLAIYASAGTAIVTNSTITHNFNGVQQGTDGAHDATIDLSGGGNSVTCSESQESSVQPMTQPGIDVYNTSRANLNASNLTWDTPDPDYFQCNHSLTVCNCNLTSCSTAAGSDDMDAVEDATYKGGIATTGNKSSGSCQ
jgi:hypothetical protein